MSEKFSERLQAIIDDVNSEKKGSQFRISEPYTKSKQPFFLELAKTLPPPKERKTYSQEEIIAMQPASTRKLMLMTDEEHKAFHDSPISTEGQTTLADIMLSDAELVAKTNTRELSPGEVINYELHRRNSKNTQYQHDPGHGNLKSTADSSVTPESKAKAVDAFVFSPPVPMDDIDETRIIGLKKAISEPPAIVPPPQKRFRDRLFDIFFGGDHIIEDDYTTRDGIISEPKKK